MRALDALRPRNPEEAAFEQSRAEQVEAAGYTVETNDGKWLTLSKNGYTIELKHFVEPSEFGYQKGKLSMIIVSKDHEPIILWDCYKGTEIPPAEDQPSAIFAEVVRILN